MDNSRANLGEEHTFASDITLDDLLLPVLKRWKLMLVVPLMAGVVGYGLSFAIPKTYQSTTTFLPPQQQQSSALASLASLGALAGLTGGAVKSPADQYVALMQSVTAMDGLIDRFKLMDAYGVPLRVEARERLDALTDISLGKKDGLIRVSVEDTDPQRAADMANQYVDELRRLTNTLAVTEAQQRRAFFEEQLRSGKEQLTQAQLALQQSGFNSDAIKAEPRAAAEAYAQLRAQLTTAEVRLQSLRVTLAEGAPEVQQLAASVQSLRQQLARLEAQTAAQVAGRDADYVGRYREFRYQEALFELMAKQYEMARLDESREGALIQVVDVAQPAERKFKPKRSLIAIGSTLLAGLALAGWLIVTSLRASGRWGARAAADSGAQ